MTTSLFVAWRAGGPDDGHWGPVGRLDRNGSGYRFSYTKGAKTLRGFSGFPEMENLDAVYESEELFPLFANRMLDVSRPEYDAFLAWSGFENESPPDAIAILDVTEGRRVTDSIEVFPLPMPGADGAYISTFFLHGIRWIPEPAHARIERLQIGERLGLTFDMSNHHDRAAVSVYTVGQHDRYHIGFVPRYLAREMRRLIEQAGRELVEISVARVNLDAPTQQRLLCRVRAFWPDGFRPCSDNGFERVGQSSASAALQTRGGSPRRTDPLQVRDDPVSG